MQTEEVVIKLGDEEWDVMLIASPMVSGFRNRTSPEEERKRDQAWEIVAEADERLRELGWLVNTSRNPKPVQREQYVDKQSQRFNASLEERRTKRSSPPEEQQA
jgi:glutamate/tyrosine decarboxylase-like PLP-dependent enzyme